VHTTLILMGWGAGRQQDYSTRGPVTSSQKFGAKVRGAATGAAPESLPDCPPAGPASPTPVAMAFTSALDTLPPLDFAPDTPLPIDPAVLTGYAGDREPE